MPGSARLLPWLLALALAWLAPPALGDDVPEYRLKAAFIYNFALFTEWPAEVGKTLHLCVFGDDPFGKEIDSLHGKKVGDHTLALQRNASFESLPGCQIVFIASSAIGDLPHVLDSLRGIPVLTVADSSGAAGRGVTLNMSVVQNRIAFEADLRAARDAGLALSSKLLRLATEVRQ